MKLLTCVVTILLLGTSGTAHAFEPGDFLVSGHLGATLAEVDYQGIYTDFNGWGVKFAVEKVLKNPHLAIGFSFDYLSSEKKLNQGTQAQLRANYSAKPLMLTLKYLFGSKPVMGHVGLGLASHFGTLEIQLEVDQPNSDEFRRFTDTSLGVAVPLGVLVHVSQNTYLDLSYTPYWIDNDLTTSFQHTFMAGLLFSFPG